MKKISNSGALGRSLAQMQCFEGNIGTCEAGLEICNLCPEKQKGLQRKWNNDFNAYYKKRRKRKYGW